MNNKKQSMKNSANNFKYAFMIAAIASVLVLGTGYSSMQSSALDYNGLGDTDLFNGLTQTAECAGLGNDCSEDNRVENNPENPPVVDPPGDPDCAVAVSCFVDRLNPTQLGNLKVTLGLASDAPDTALCEAIAGMTAAELRAAITAPVVGVTVAVANNIINCLIDEAGFTFTDIE
ncbi:MAG TPA: hypothetical protein VER14_07465 [Phototrophicaceae bacterium]|nr:hypothetical protein [Phototrophicaceae bacterium]